MKKSNIFNSNEEVKCEYCGKKLMDNPTLSMVQIVCDNENKITGILPCCKGKCDKELKNRIKDNNCDGWKEFDEFINPYLYIKHIMAVLNSMYEGRGFANKEAFESYKDLIIKCYPYITRDLTKNEIENANFDEMFPF